VLGDWGWIDLGAGDRSKEAENEKSYRHADFNGTRLAFGQGTQQANVPISAVPVVQCAMQPGTNRQSCGQDQQDG